MIQILIILSIFSFPEMGETNQTPDGIEICNFYKEAESKYMCGKNGLFQKMGIKYCDLSFDAHFNDGLDEDKNFTKCVRECFIDQTRSFLKAHPDALCEEIWNIGIAIQPDCYTKCGLCENCSRRKNTMIKLYDFLDILTNFGITIKLLRMCGGILTGAYKCFIASDENVLLPNSQELFLDNLTLIEDVEQLINLTKFKDASLDNLSEISISVFSPVILFLAFALFVLFD